jgi:hypothetical protein
MPRFVILEHDSPDGRHWDFMLEAGPSLATWAIAEPPDAEGPVAARWLADHRLDYLDYEGPISRGRGKVTRWDHGEYEEQSRSDEQRVVSLSGERLRGTATLTQSLEDPKGWLFLFVAERDV